MNKQKPAHEIRLGRIRATLWANESEHGTRFKVSLSRLYRDDDGWHDTGYFDRDDLLTVAKVSDLAHSWIHEQNGERPGEEPKADDVEEAPTPVASATRFGRRR
jgi:hypothetical protein